MTVFNLITLGGGVALFLYGMNVMGAGLEKLAGSKMEKMLEKLTGNIFMSVALGAAVTAIIQSSSATTVIVVGLVNAGIMQLRQAVGVIMGANIGTTITAQLIRLSDIEGGSAVLKLFKPATLAPLAALVGIVLFMVCKKAKKKELGQMLLGFGILFSGMFAMEDAMSPLTASPAFMNILSALTNPVLGVIAGAVITALIQSSSASIGMLQALASTGAITFSAAFPIIMGQNIGTCITPIMSSIGASKNAKRSALIHLYFNIIGTVLFLLGTYGLKALLGAPAFWDAAVGRSGIANFHTMFNIVVTLALIPFAGIIERLAYRSVKEGEQEQGAKILEMLDERFLDTPPIAMQQCGHVICSMASLSQQNYFDSIELIARYDGKTAERINETENLVDKIEDTLENYLIKLSAREISDSESKKISAQLHMIKDYERISDYSINLSECAQQMLSNNVVFSQDAVDEIDILLGAVSEIIEMANSSLQEYSPQTAKLIEPLEETVDAMVDYLKDKHIERLKEGSCSAHSGIMFLEILTNLERIADHCSNIGISIIGLTDDRARGNAHGYLKRAHEAAESEYAAAFDGYMAKYFDAVKNAG